MNEGVQITAGRADSPVPLRGGLLQRTCASCSGRTSADSQCKECDDQKGTLQRKPSNNFSPVEVPSIVHEVLRSAGQPLDVSTRAFFEPRFAHNFGRLPLSLATPQLSSSSLVLGEPNSIFEYEADHLADTVMRTELRGKTVASETEGHSGFNLSGVRIHTDTRAAESARAVNAAAYTVGSDIVFGAGKFAPNTSKGRRLIAHELAHAVQQGAAGASTASTARRQVLQRAPLEILPADSTATPKTNERKAAASCAITCGKSNIGTLHAMPIFFHATRGTPLASSSGANGIGTSLHFMRVSTVLPAANPCLTCTDYKIIQIINSNEPSDSRNKESFVDNAAGSTPFYGDVYKSGSGVHQIPTGYPDGGAQVQTAHSIYDRPYRGADRLAIVTGKNFFWNAEACVTCVKPGKDKVLGCVTYGFKRDWDAKASAHGPVQVVGPGCLATPSSHFTTTLKSDSSTSGYAFET